MSKIHESAFIAPGAVVLGDVTIGEHVGIWYHTTIRGDRASITIGKNSNIQDNCVIHVGVGYPVEIGEGVTVGHSAIVHGSKVGDSTLVGMGAILMNGSVIGRNCIIGAGALVTQNMVIPDDSVVLGSPGKVVRQVTAKDIEANKHNADLYVQEAAAAKECLD